MCDGFRKVIVLSCNFARIRELSQAYHHEKTLVHVSVSARMQSLGMTTSSNTDTSPGGHDTRVRQYWSQQISAFGAHSTDLMMLRKGNTAEGVEEADRHEIVSWVTQAVSNLSSARVLDLGAGSGRFTTEWSKRCHSTVALELMPELVEENRAAHARAGLSDNCRFVCGSAASAEFEPGSFDLVFSNWLLMYLAEADVAALLAKIVGWLRPGGVFFFRESIGSPAPTNPDNIANNSFLNPTAYRPASFYSNACRDLVMSGDVRIIFSERPVGIYVKSFGAQNQCCWMITKSS